MKNIEIEPMKVMISIVERGQGRKMIELFKKEAVTHHFQCSGVGTATSEIMDLLGLDSLEKDVIFSIAKGTLINQLMRDLNYDLRGRTRARGIVFDMKLTGMAHAVAFAIQFPVKDLTGREDTMMEEGMESSMILVTVNQGFTEEVMETARKAGARGGTIIHARWAGSESTEEFFGITVQEEKEIIAIIVPNTNRKDIMEAIYKNHGLKTEARGTVCSLAIEDMVKLG